MFPLTEALYVDSDTIIRGNENFVPRVKNASSYKYWTYLRFFFFITSCSLIQNQYNYKYVICSQGKPKNFSLIRC